MSYWKTLQGLLQTDAVSSNGVEVSVSGGHLTASEVEAIAQRVDAAHVEVTGNIGTRYKWHRFLATPIDGGSPPFRGSINESSSTGWYEGNSVLAIVHKNERIKVKISNIELPDHPNCQVCRRLRHPDKNRFEDTW